MDIKIQKGGQYGGNTVGEAEGRRQGQKDGLLTLTIVRALDFTSVWEVIEVFGEKTDMI